MKFIKGIIIGGMITAGVTMLCNEGMMDKKRIMKKGKHIARKLGII